jgi:nucleoside-diphosphate-sugar epimerase
MIKNKILVTGASGFIGSALVRSLAERKIPFITLDEGQNDVTKKESFDFPFSNQVAHVIHLAGKTFVPDSWIDPDSFIHVNTQGTENVLEFCRKNGCSISYISAYIYGNPVINPINEDHPVNVNNPYALSKKMAEEICLFYARHFHVPVSIIRPFNVYGKGQNSAFLIPEVIKQATSSAKIHVKDLVPKRDFIYVDDLVDLIIKTFEKKAQGIFNAGFGKSFSVKELIDTVQKVLNTQLPVSGDNVERKNEISDTVADISKARKELQWSPATDLETGIRKMIGQA